MSFSDDIDELVEMGELEVAKELVINHYEHRLDHMPHWEKVFWGYIEATPEERDEARDLYLDDVERRVKIGEKK